MPDCHIPTIRAGTKPTLIKNAKIWTGLHNGTFGYSQLGAYWVTPFLVGYTNYASPELEGASAADDNILKGTAQPWLRSLDGLNTHDDAYPLSIAVVTTALILPGSANSIGVQALVIKLHHTEERSPSSMLLGPPY
ncbi:hypothetical protein ARMSODRAFT_1017126 [Armillaria solidipes]|uniref:Uncharacterized protein n=1 Tax=Armillaria solidipes TaxID=1076256 RepID=A0A2H3BK28_9AGAR|nr:hypothetical protein ARMSODRAFT_1017126 [Armillaria solidipes]